MNNFISYILMFQNTIQPIDGFFIRFMTFLRLILGSLLYKPEHGLYFLQNFYRILRITE